MGSQIPGEVIKVYVKKDGCYFSLNHIGQASGRNSWKRDLFFMDKDIENYNSFYSLLTVAAVNGYRLTVTTSNRINDQEYGDVTGMWIDWER